MANTSVVGVGVLAFLAGVFCSMYSVTSEHFFGLVTETTYPLQSVGMPLMIIGLVVAIVGLVLPSHKEGS